MGTDPHDERVVDRDRLSAYLTDQLGPAEHRRIVRHPGGHSNETIFIEWDGQYVLRRPPLGAVGEKAHDVLREYRIIEALQDSDVPVPQTVLSCPDTSVIGAEFYVMRRAQGEVYRPSNPPAFAAADDRHRLGLAHVDTLAAVHQVDLAETGLSSLGHPTGFTARQIDIWHAQLRRDREVTHAERPIEGADAIATWLRAHRPTVDRPRLVHGDFKLDNLMFDADDPGTVTAIFDWELCTVGDPLSDLGWLLFFWHESGDPEVSMPDLMPRFTSEKGYPSRAQLADRYTNLTGIPARAMDFYQGLAAFKMIALGEMFFARHLRGDSDDPLYPKMRTGVPDLIDQTRTQLGC